MLFSSFRYIWFFLPVAAVVLSLLQQNGKLRLGQFWLLFASLVFYASAQIQYLPLLVASVVINWSIARQITVSAGEPVSARWLSFGIVLNVLTLFGFKYLGFFASSTNELLGTAITVPNLMFPLGISFYSIAQIMYLVDRYQNTATYLPFLDHAVAVTFFPSVTSGPIIRLSELGSQFDKEFDSKARWESAARGLLLLSMGLAKKTLLADSFADLADAGYSSIENLSVIEAWAFTVAYTMQIYFDFSGYSDMAVGSALICGFEIPRNFNAPFRAKSVSEFWQRWHISLSNFITNYLYTPILRSFGKATIQTSAIAILIAMGIAGLWHGPALTYIVFGLVHGIGLAFNQYWKKRKWRLPGGFSWILTFAFINASFVIFRASDMQQALHVLELLVHGSSVWGTAVLGSALPLTITSIGRPVVVGLILAVALPTSDEISGKFKFSALSVMGCVLLLSMSFLEMNSTVAKKFVYFAF